MTFVVVVVDWDVVQIMFGELPVYMRVCFVLILYCGDNRIYIKRRFRNNIMT